MLKEKSELEEKLVVTESQALNTNKKIKETENLLEAKMEEFD